MTVDNYVKTWIEKAEHDFIAAKKEPGSAEPLTDIACFHCQQSVEKPLKAFLVHKRTSFPGTHVLEDLVKLRSSNDESFGEFMDDVGELSGYAVEIRYPDDFYVPSLEEATSGPASDGENPGACEATDRDGRIGFRFIAKP